MAHISRPRPEEFLHDNPHRPLDPRPRGRRASSSPVAFLAVVMMVMAVIVVASFVAYRYDGRSSSIATQQTAAPDIGTPAVRPSDTTGAASKQQ